MNKSESQYRHVLYTECFGFIALLFITWIDEGLTLPRSWIGPWFAPGTMHEALLESFAIIIVGVAVTTHTYKLLQRIQNLESLLKVCAWCRKLELDGKWVSMEDYLHHSDIQCTHGICEDCAAQFKETSLSAKIPDAPEVTMIRGQFNGPGYLKPTLP